MKKSTVFLGVFKICEAADAEMQAAPADYRWMCYIIDLTCGLGLLGTRWLPLLLPSFVLSSWTLPGGPHPTSPGLMSLPAKVLASHLIEMPVERAVEVSQFLDHSRVDVGMDPAFCFAQAVRFAIALWLLQARETLGLVEEEVVICYEPLQAQEVLDFAQLSSWVSDQFFPTDKVHLG